MCIFFQATEDSLREHFASFGDITDVNILKKPNGKLVGCAFIQYKTVPQAAKALKELNLKPFLGEKYITHILLTLFAWFNLNILLTLI